MPLKLLLFLSCLYSGYIHSQQLFFINNSASPKGHVIDFTKSELNNFLNGKCKSCQFTFEFKKNDSLSDGSFAFEIIKKKEKSFQVILSGEKETEILHAAHSFLEHLGFQFDMYNSIMPTAIDVKNISIGYFPTIPYTRWRGIRQHVNFPMDISSYPLEEAREYLNKLIRLRFNKLAVHSYPNLWHEVNTGDSIEYAGNFFYNRSHEIPALPIFKNHIRYNKKLFSIPSIEPFYTDTKIRSAMAIDWMKSLLTHAKHIGFKIHFSIEPRNKGDIGYITDNIQSAIACYPMMDEIEINTEELGGWGDACSDSTVKSMLTKWFGQAVLTDTFVTRHIQKNQTDLDNLVNQIGRNLAAYRLLKIENTFTKTGITPKIGIYCTIAPYADLAYYLVRKYAPEVELTIMPGHGSVRTANHFSQIRKFSTDLRFTTLFSWLEFDGLMFTQQNPIAGIEALFQQLDSIKGNQQVNALLFNHWRTSENSLATRYAAESVLYGPLERKKFYEKWASHKKISDPKIFTESMEQLEWIDTYSTNELPNYGFCWLGAWTQGGPYMWINREKLKKVELAYHNVRQSLQSLLMNTIEPAAKMELEFLLNRIDCSIFYIKAFDWGCRIQELQKDNHGNYLTADKEKALIYFNHAMNAFQQYMAKHTNMMPDRGAEGTLINLWHGPIHGLKVLREKVTGLNAEIPFSTDEDGDGPPLPILIKEPKKDPY
jgi:hypothetical protein